MEHDDFYSQSITIVENLMNYDNMSREGAMKLWFNSKTYHEILRRRLTYISAMRAYSELKLENENNSEWMENTFDL